ncbi:MAG: hypothetical protein ACOYL3_14865 [Desulfuromonadaceae bacterium]
MCQNQFIDNNRKELYLSRMRKHLSLLIICLLLFSVVTTAFHYHDNDGDHADCSICAVSHHQPVANNSPVVLSSVTTYTLATWRSPECIFISPDAYRPANDRAPPA